MFNTLLYTKKLEEVGVSREQAEAHIQIMTEVMQNELATKGDVRELRHEMHYEMQRLEYRLTVRFGSMMAASTTIIIAVLALILKT